MWKGHQQQVSKSQAWVQWHLKFKGHKSAAFCHLHGQLAPSSGRYVELHYCKSPLLRHVSISPLIGCRARITWHPPTLTVPSEFISAFEQRRERALSLFSVF